MVMAEAVMEMAVMQMVAAGPQAHGLASPVDDERPTTDDDVACRCRIVIGTLHRNRAAFWPRNQPTLRPIHRCLCLHPFDRDESYAGGHQ